MGSKKPRYKVDNQVIVDLYSGGTLTMKEVGKLVGVPENVVFHRLKKFGIGTNAHHTVNDYSFDEITKESCYWAGFLAADGCIAKKFNRVEIELQHLDIEHLKKLCRFVKRDTDVWTRERSRNNKQYKYASISIVSKKIVKDLEDKFCVVSNKSLILEKPNIPNNLSRHFIRGFVDGDGCIDWHNNAPRVNIVTGSSNIIEWIKSEIVRCVPDTFCPKTLSRSTSKALSIEFGGKHTAEILNWLYTDSTDNTRLTRKYERFLEYTQAQNESK